MATTNFRSVLPGNVKYSAIHTVVITGGAAAAVKSNTFSTSAAINATKYSAVCVGMTAASIATTDNTYWGNFSGSVNVAAPLLSTAAAVLTTAATGTFTAYLSQGNAALDGDTITLAFLITEYY